MTFEDWCGVKKLVDELNDAGVIDNLEYVRQNPDFLGKLGPAAKILDANPAAVTVYKASDKATLLSAFNEPLSLDTYNPTTGLSDIFVTFVVTFVDKFSRGETRVELEFPDTALDDSVIYVRTTTSITRGHENDWPSALQTVEDFTRRKAAEDGHELQVGASIGIGVFPDDANTAEELRDCADQALYEAKRAGRISSAGTYALRRTDLMADADRRVTEVSSVHAKQG